MLVNFYDYAEDFHTIDNLKIYNQDEDGDEIDEDIEASEYIKELVNWWFEENYHIEHYSFDDVDELTNCIENYIFKVHNGSIIRSILKDLLFEEEEESDEEEEESDEEEEDEERITEEDDET